MSKIFVKVKTRARKTGVEKIDETHFVVRVKTPPVDGKANDSVIAALAVFLGVPKSQIQLKSGAASSQKTFVI